MKKVFFCIVCILLFGIVAASNAEDLNDVTVLRQHFETQQAFEQWYSQLNQEDKNLALAGTVYECRPDLTKAAMRMGGNIDTQVFIISVNSGHDEDVSDYIYAYTSGDEKDFTIEAMSDGMKRSAAAVKKESCGHTFSFFSNTSSGLISLLSASIDACNNSDRKDDMFKFLLENVKTINHVNEELVSPLSKAIKHNNIDMVELLLQNGADFNQTYALSYVIREFYSYQENRVNDAMWDYVVSYLQKHKLSAEAETDAFIQILLNTDNELKQKLAPLNLQPDYSTLAAKKGLILAANRHNYELMKDLVEHGVDVNYKDKNGRTALFWLAEDTSPRNEDIEAVRYLLNHGADANIKDKQGKTAFDDCAYAICKLNPNGVRRFNTDDKTIVPSLDQAIDNNDCDTITYFIENGVDPYIDVYGTALLFRLYRYEHRNCLEKVLKLKPDLNSPVLKKGSFGIEDVDTPLTYARNNRWLKDVIPLLQQYGATDTDDTPRIEAYKEIQQRNRAAVAAVLELKNTDKSEFDAIKNKIKQKLEEQGLKDWEIGAYQYMLETIDSYDKHLNETRHLH